MAFVRRGTPFDHLNQVAVRISQSAEKAERHLLDLAHPCDVLAL